MSQSGIHCSSPFEFSVNSVNLSEGTSYFTSPPIKTTPFPVVDVTIEDECTSNGSSGPEKEFEFGKIKMKICLNFDWYPLPVPTHSPAFFKV